MDGVTTQAQAPAQTAATVPDTTTTAAATTTQVQAPDPQVQTQTQASSDSLLGDLYQGQVDTAATQEPQAQTQQQEPTVPENYDFEGVQLKDYTYLEQDKAMVNDLGKSLGLTNEQARKLLETGGDVLISNMQAKLQQNVNTWKAQIASDPELGGNNYNTTRTNLARVIKRYASPEALAVLDRSGVGAHPAIVRMLNAMGRELGQEQRFVQGGQPAPHKQSPLRALYPNSPELKFGDE